MVVASIRRRRTIADTYLDSFTIENGMAGFPEDYGGGAVDTTFHVGLDPITVRLSAEGDGGGPFFAAGLLDVTTGVYQYGGWNNDSYQYEDWNGTLAFGHSYELDLSVNGGHGYAQMLLGWNLQVVSPPPSRPRWPCWPLAGWGFRGDAGKGKEGLKRLCPTGN